MDPLDYAGNVHHWAGRYLGIARARGMDRDDLAQIGYTAVLKAWRTHEANGHPDQDFVGYVGPWIRGAMHRAIHTPGAVAASLTGPIDDDLDPGRVECDDGEDEAAAMLRVLTDKQARAVELYLGLDGAPCRSIGEVSDLMGCGHVNNASRLVKAGLANLRRHSTSHRRENHENRRHNLA